MSLYLYAIAHGDAAQPGDSGLSGGRLRVVRQGELAAVVSDHAGPPPAPNEDSLWEHERVVEALMSAGDVLPARFGSVVDSEAAVRALLDDRRDELTSALDRVAGAVELGVRVAWAPDPGTSAASTADDSSRRSGADYLRARAASRDRAERIASTVSDALRPAAREVTTRAPASAASIVSAFLVERSQVERFRDCVDRLEQELPAAEIVCTGPWPPYSFVEGVAHG